MENSIVTAKIPLSSKLILMRYLATKMISGARNPNDNCLMLVSLAHAVLGSPQILHGYI